MSEEPKSSGTVGSLFGILVFLIGIGLIVLTFKLALELFNIDPKTALNLGTGGAVDLGKIAPTLFGIIVKVLMLCVMAMIGGMIANRGIRLYVDSRVRNSGGS